MTGQSESVDQVMNQVLLAEREAREAVARCRSEAAQIRVAAEEDARRIADRTEGRIKLAGHIADRAVERTLRGLQGTEPGAAAAVPEGEVRELLDRAVDGLVDEILGFG